MNGVHIISPTLPLAPSEPKTNSLPMRKPLLITVVSLFMLLPLNLYAGGIKGRVFDKNTKDPLPGANIVVKGTVIGAAADVNGLFSIPNVPAGRQTIEVSYIGYNKETVVLTIPDKGILTRDFALTVDVIPGQEVVVLAQAQGQMQAINQQLASNKIASIVSEARIQELPDFNAAQALSRLPGVSTLESSGEANKVVIRGIAPQYNTISVEGVKLASTGSSQIGITSLGLTAGNVNNDRSVDLSMVSPYMIKSISVYKSLTPDMNANSIGGSVNMELREAPSGLHYDLLWQSGYTAMTKNFGNYRAVGSLSTRLYNELFGIYILGNAERYDRDADNMSATYATTQKTVDTTTGYRPVEVTTVTLNRHIETRERYGANLIADYKLPAGHIKFVNMFTRLISDYDDYNTVIGYKEKYLDFRLRQGKNTTDLSVNSLELKYDWNWLATDAKFAATTSRNWLPETPFARFRQTGGITGVIQDNTIPDSLKKQIVFYGPEKALLSDISLFKSLYTEKNYSANTNLKIPYRFGSFIQGYIKFGGEIRHQKNNNDQAAPYAGMQRGSDIQELIIDTLAAMYNLPLDSASARFSGASFMGDEDLLKPFLDNRFGQIYYVCNPDIFYKMAKFLSSDTLFKGRVGGPQQTGGWYNGIFQTLANDYHFTEDYYATYMMGELNFWKFLIVGGYRYEKTKSKYTTYNMFDMRSPDTQKADTAIATPKSEFLLPMVQIKFAPFKWVNFRYSYTQTLARPDYHALSPKVSMSSDRRNVWAGNPDLRPAQAFNQDAALTFHSNYLGLLAVGAFYKTIEDFTYYTRYQLYDTTVYEGVKTTKDFVISGSRPENGAFLNTYVNSKYPAYVKGLEIDFQTRLWYLPWHLDGIVLGLNYTKIKSETKYPYRDSKTVLFPNPKGGRPITKTVTFDSTRAGRLIYQPDDILNAHVGYEIGGFSARLSFVFQGNSVNSIGAFPEEDGYTKDYFRVDFSARQKLPWYGMEVYLDVNNLNNRKNEAAQNSINGFTNIKHYGLVANAGIRLRL
jgi:TonB-dependent receptor